MKVLILGGTGMLGYPIALEFLKQGHEVVAAARSAAKLGPAFDDHVKLHLLPLDTASMNELAALMSGVDVVVQAFGADDRVVPAAPALPFFQEQLGGVTERVVLAARQAGVRRVVVLGSYFVTMHRLHPDWQLAQHHPYIAARLEQEGRAFAAGEAENGLPRTDVMVLELPYIFGVTPGRTPFWKEVLFDRLKAMSFVMYPRGGSAVLTTRQVGEATLGAALRGNHRKAYAVADVNLTWNELVGLIRAELGQSTHVLNVPAFLTNLPLKQEAAKQQKEGQEGGLNLNFLARDIMHREFFVDAEKDRAILGHQPGGVPEAIRETVRASYPELNKVE
ncbi:NAD-dependent epimerase/dehydratase family protein [Deinococcus fonticola]|uniref:NAD-dependent epimerase/dehydratase family protein n=1 Tax=Deinococcus fonticola TaxID=2528713 RepID=UPI0010757DCF|nr:NAD(P)-dependent oxidoreductase [Deinococcus fonticola]